MVSVLKKTMWIAAEPTAVFDHYVDAAKAAIWMGMDLVLEPHEGGRYALDMGLAGTVEGCVLEYERPTRIHHSVGDVDGARGSRIELSFQPEDGGTRLTLVHSGLDGQGAELASRAWDNQLARWAVAATGGAPGPDPMLKMMFPLLGLD